MPESEILTLFAELGTTDAREVLTQLMSRLATSPVVHDLRLLQSTEQPNLHLLIVTCTQEPAVDWPAACKRWTFRTIVQP